MSQLFPSPFFFSIVLTLSLLFQSNIDLEQVCNETLSLTVEEKLSNIDLEQIVRVHDPAKFCKTSCLKTLR